MTKLLLALWLLVLATVACGGTADPSESADGGPDTNTSAASEGDSIGEETPTTAPLGVRDFMTLSFNTLIRVNPDDGTVTELGEVDGNVLAITSGGGSVWMAREDGSVVRMSPATGEVEAEIDTGVADLGAIIAYSEEGVWTVHGIIGSANTVSMIDPASNVAHHTVTGEEGGYILDIAAGEGAGWGIGSNRELASILYRFDPLTGERQTHDVGVVASDVATGGGYIWVVGSGFAEDNTPQSGVGRFDPSASTTEFFPVGEEPENVLFAYDSVWVGDPLGGDGATLHRLDPSNGQPIASLPVGDTYAGVMGLYAGAGFLWASTDNGLFVIEPENNSIAGEGDPPSQALLFP